MSIWADQSIVDLQHRVAALEARVTELVAQNAALAAKLVPTEAPPPPPPPPIRPQVSGRRG